MERAKNSGMYLIIDVGNSRVKVVLMEDSKIIYQAVSEALDDAILSEVVEQYGGIDSAIISTTRGDGNNLEALVGGYVERVLLFTPAANPYQKWLSYTSNFGR